MFGLLGLRAALVFLLVCLLSGCSSTEAIRGRLTYDLRPAEARSHVFWPASAEVPRYRYLGELVGEPNFVDVSDKTLNPLFNFFRWVAGIFEDYHPEMLYRPGHGTVDEKGRVYVVDAGRSAVVVFDPKAPEEEESDKGEGQLLIWEFADGQTRFDAPIAAATVWGGNIAVSDAKLGWVALLNEKGESVAKVGEGLLGRPTGLAFDSSTGLLYVADTMACEIKVFNEAGEIVKVIGSPGQAPGELNAPTHLAVADGRLYVSDTLNSRVQVFDSAGRNLRQFGEQGPYVGNLTRPKGIAVSEGGVVYVIESYFSHLLAFNERSELLMGINGSGLNNGGFLLPSGVWTDKEGRVFIADMFNGRVVVFQFLGHDGR